MKKLTKEQMKIIYRGAATLIFFISFWLFIYLPRSRQVSAIKTQLQAAQEQIDQINQLIGERELAQAVGDLRTNIDKLKSSLPFRDETVIGQLSQAARNLNLEIKNIASSGKQDLDYQVAGLKLQKLAISIDLVGEFKSLGEYLDILRNNFPVLVTVNTLNINGKGEGKPSLDINLKLWAYLAKN